jgi:hypothetical protein
MGTDLSQAKANRKFSQFPAIKQKIKYTTGQVVGCYPCHQKAINP